MCLLYVCMCASELHTHTYTHTLKMPDVHFWLCNNAYLLHCLVKTKRSCCMTHAAVRLLLLLESSWVTRPAFSLFWPSSSFHVPSFSLPFHSLPPLFPSPFLFSSIHYQEGQPVEAPVSPTPSQRGLVAAAAATVSELKPTNRHVLFEEVANSAAEFFLTVSRAWDMCALGKYVLVTHWEDDRKDFHLLGIDSDIIFTIGPLSFHSVCKYRPVYGSRAVVIPSPSPIILIQEGSSWTHPLSCLYFVTMYWMGFFSMEWEHLCDSWIDFPAL